MKGKQSLDSLDVLYIELTTKCNLNCIHCGNEEKNAQELDLDLVEKLLHEFKEADGKKLVLTGGEPLMHPNIERILQMSSQQPYNTKLSTNATLLNQPRFGFVLDQDIGFRVSLDGTEEVHNEIRRDKNAYVNLIEAMKQMSKRRRQIVIRTTVMKKNKDSIVNMLFELDCISQQGLSIYSINIWPIRDIGCAQQEQILSAQEYKGFLETLNKGTRGLNPNFRIIVGPTFGMEREFKGGPIQSNQIYRCDLLNTSVHISASGEIYPCSFVHYSLGNVRKTSIRQIFRSKKAKEFRRLFLSEDNHDCAGCEDYDSCRAGCIAERYKELLVNPGQRVKDVYCFREPNLELKCTRT